MRNYTVLDSAFNHSLILARDVENITGEIFYKISIGYHTKVIYDYIKAKKTFDTIKEMMTPDESYITGMVQCERVKSGDCENKICPHFAPHVHYGACDGYCSNKGFTRCIK